ncbi:MULTISPECIES: tetratricopeptide repeat protein [Cupriavidus]
MTTTAATTGMAEMTGVAATLAGGAARPLPARRAARAAVGAARTAESHDQRRLLAAVLVAVAVAAGCVGGASVWRERAAARRLELTHWQALAGTDRQALAALRAAARQGEAAAQAALGEALLAGGDAAQHAEGSRWLREAAEGGDARAHFLLGKAAFSANGDDGSDGSDGDKPDGSAPDAAAAWHHFELAAAAGDSGAAYYLGLLHRGGYGRAPDAATAARWFGVAADAGVAPAMFMLANAYRDGAGVARDERRALAWYEAAAQRGHAAAIRALARR